VSGTFPGYKQGTWFLSHSPFQHPGAITDPCIYTADLKALVEGQGATFSSSVSQDCTHLVATEKDVEKESTKCMLSCGW
jgi:hypothetical protein